MRRGWKPIEWMLRQVDRMISNRDILVDMDGVMHSGEIACTTGLEIFINPDTVEKMILDRKREGETPETLLDMSVACIRGLNYHELAHVLYTPREMFMANHPAMSGDPRAAYFVKMMEEGRIESLFCSGKAAVAKLSELTYYQMRWLESDYQGMDLTALVLLLSREYLADPSVYLAESPPTASYDLDRISEICHEYNRLKFPAQLTRAMKLGKELAAMEKEHGEQRSFDGRDGGYESDSWSSMGVGSPVPQKEMPDIEGAALIGQINASEIGGSNIEDIQKNILEDEEVAEIIDHMVKALGENTKINQAGIASGKIEMTHFKRASQEMKTEAARINQAIRRMTIDTEMERRRRQATGRVDTNRLMLNEDALDVFQQVIPGAEDEIPVDVLVAIDTSGSMAGFRSDKASEALWLMHQATHALSGSQLAAFGFNYDYSLLIPPTQRATGMYGKASATGGTSIIGLLSDVAVPYFRASIRPNKFLIVLSDGDWGSKEEVDVKIRALNHMGVTTAHFGVGHHHPEPGTFTYASHVEQIEDVAKISIRMFTEVLRRYSEEVVV